MTPPPDPSNRPFFIVGSGRSGSTLLRLILSGHSRLCVSPETWFLQPLLAELPTDRVLTAVERARALAIMTHHYRWPDLGIDAAEFRAALGDRESTLRDMTDALYARLALNAGKQRVGDKTPVYVGILPELTTLYPDAKIIYLLRDGRDVAVSYIDAGLNHRCYQGADFEWTAAVRAARRFAASSRPRSWLEIRYEEFVQNPEPVVRALCAFLGETFEPKMLDAASRADLVPERERKIHGRVSGPIDAGRAGAWRSRLGRTELFVLESCLGADLRASGYALGFAGPAWRRALALSGAIMTGAGSALMRIVPALKRRNLISPRALV